MTDFDKIYSEYFSAVYKFVLGLCRNPSLAEEITQEAFFKALKNIEKYNEKYKMSTWLCQIAKNTYYTYVKKRGRSVCLSGEADATDLEGDFADRESAFLIHTALHTLKEPYKEVFHLRTFGELPFSQIGLIFGKTENWARVTYYRAKTMIKEELDDELSV